MRIFLSKRLPFGLRAGFSIPLRSGGSRQRRTRPTLGAQVGYVYVIAAADGTVKIGQTTSPRARLATLQTSSPVALRMHYLLATDQNPAVIEAAAHRALAAHRCAGEWFDVSAETAQRVIDQAAAMLAGTPVAHTDSARLAGAVADGRISMDAPGPRWWLPDWALFLGLFVVAYAAIRLWLD